ncbi:MAG: hypothetical protein AAF558_06650 [Verrucomicrobiota bacterium]
MRIFTYSALIAVTLLASASHARWEPVEFTNAELREKGTLTGDGCQWVRALAVDSNDGRFMLWCTDVGGLFRSLDSGKNWEPTNVGFHSRGSSGVAIDPNNPNRAVVIAANSVAHHFNGIYITTDQAASWKQVLSVEMGAGQDRRTQVVYDPTSFDKTLGYTTTLYWSTLSDDKPTWGESKLSASFYKSVDGGSNWIKVDGGEKVADAYLAIHPNKGYIYAGTPKGFYISQDGGTSWKKTLSKEVTGLSVSKTRPESVYISLTDKILRSDDEGETWTDLESAGTIMAAESTFRNITVSPSDPSRIVLWRESPNWNWPRFYSKDGGQSWNESIIKKDKVIVPTNSRQALFSFHPSNPDIILSTGGDYPTLSYNGGETYTFAGNGVNNLYVGSPFNFSLSHPNVFLFSSQDYASLVTTDGGKNWKYLEAIPRGWGGFNYGGFAADERTYIVGDSETPGAPNRRVVSLDGGQSWEASEQVIEPHISNAHPKHSNIIFAGSFRSEDSGRTWSPMTDVSGVYTYNIKDGQLFGIKLDSDSANSTVVKSSDQGQNWSEIFSFPKKLQDIAFDPKRNRIYFVTEWSFHYWQDGKITQITNLPKDQDGGTRVLSVALDPVDSSIVYVAGNRNAFASNTSALRSLDAGVTWQNLTLLDPLDGSLKDGGRESQWVRVHPITRIAWFTTGCYGIWKYVDPKLSPETSVIPQEEPTANPDEATESMEEPEKPRSLWERLRNILSGES